MPSYWQKNIKDVTAADVLKILNNTINRVTKETNGKMTGESAALQNRRFIGAVTRYAIATLRLENDPTYAVRDVIKRPRVKHARALTKEERKRQELNCLNTMEQRLLRMLASFSYIQCFGQLKLERCNGNGSSLIHDLLDFQKRQ